MFFRSSVFNQFLISSCVGIFLFTTACGDPALVGGTQVQALPTCISATPNTDSYILHSRAGVIKVYQDYKSGLISYDSARQVSFSLLGENMKHWSDHVDVAVDEGHMIRIVITYIDPVLVQYIVLNHVLTYTSSMTDMPGFEAMLNTTMNGLSNRNEMLFMVTVTSPFYNTNAYNSNVLTVKFPITQMALANASGLKIIPTHADPILSESIDITHGPIFGLVGYPLAVINQSQCTQVIDSWSNQLILELPSVTLGSTTFPSKFWNIPYRALILQAENQPTPTYDPSFDWNRVSRLNAPPTPNWKPSLQFDDTNWKIYWEDMGRYLWDVVISESHH